MTTQTTAGTGSFTVAQFRARATGVLAPARSSRGPDDSLRGDHDLNPDNSADMLAAELRRAAVLVPIVDRASEATVLLTQRTDHLPTHAGQISFPGGKIEPTDADAVGTALRETQEEIGLSDSFVDILGRLDPYRTGTGYCITPIVSVIAPGFDLTLDRSEVDEVFEVPLAFLMDPDNHRKERVMWQGRNRSFYAMPYGERYIWGATAGMLRNLYEKVYGS